MHLWVGCTCFCGQALRTVSAVSCTHKVDLSPLGCSCALQGSLGISRATADLCMDQCLPRTVELAWQQLTDDYIFKLRSAEPLGESFSSHVCTQNQAAFVHASVNCLFSKHFLISLSTKVALERLIFLCLGSLDPHKRNEHISCSFLTHSGRQEANPACFSAPVPCSALCIT